MMRAKVLVAGVDLGFHLQALGIHQRTLTIQPGCVNMPKSIELFLAEHTHRGQV
jgi:hypothetical protein